MIGLGIAHLQRAKNSNNINCGNSDTYNNNNNNNRTRSTKALTVNEALSMVEEGMMGLCATTGPVVGRDLCCTQNTVPFLFHKQINLAGDVVYSVYLLQAYYLAGMYEKGKRNPR